MSYEVDGLSSWRPSLNASCGLSSHLGAKEERCDTGTSVHILWVRIDDA